MQKEYKFQIEEAIEIPDWADLYPQSKFSVYKCCFLSTKPNSHKIPITDEILRRDAKTILGTWLIAKIEFGDATTHKPQEQIYGHFPINQEIEFVEEDGITKAYAYAVVSKRYSAECNGIFEYENFRNSSVEMLVNYADENDENSVNGIDIQALTILGRAVKGSCPDANVKIVRFSKKCAEKYFAKNDTLSDLKQFAQERKQSMAEKSYKVDKSKEAMSDADWGSVDKADLRDKIMEASNRGSLIKDVYMLIEAGWEDAPSEHLKYPVMCFDGDTLVYNRGALSSALSYSKKEGETAVVNKIEKIYNNLGLDDSEGKEEDAKMEQFEEAKMEETAAEVEEMEEKKPDEEGEAEAEAKEEMAEPTAMEESSPEPEEEAEDEEHEHGDDCDCSECRMSKMADKIAQLEKEAEDKDNIIMDKDAELAELRQFKAGIEEKEKAMAVEAVMAEVADFLEKDMAESLRSEGMSCGKEDIDAWANKCKAMCFSAVKKAPEKKKDNLGVFSFAAPIENQKTEDGDIWSRLKKNYK